MKKGADSTGELMHI